MNDPDGVQRRQDDRRDGTIPDLAAPAKILFGEQWRRPMAAALGVSERSVYRWEADSRLVPWSAWSMIVDLLDARAIESRRAATRLSLDVGMARAGARLKRPSRK